MPQPNLWSVFSAAPHRMLMFGGALQLVAVMLYWAVELIGRYTGLWAPLATPVPGIFAHAFLMLYCLFTFFFFGFLMTTYPRWMNGEVIPRRRYATSFVLLGSAVLTLYLGLVLGKGVYTLGAALLLAGLLSAQYALWRVYRTAPSRDKFYETLLNAILLLGDSGVAAYLGWLLNDAPALLHYALTVGLWGFLLPVILTVSHRMLPFFSSGVIQPYAVYHPRNTLLAMLACTLGHGLLELLHLPAWTWLVDLPLLLLALHHTRRWDIRRSFQARLLAVLHVAFAWVSLGMLLYTVHSLALLLDLPFSLGRAPLHALAIGTIAAITLGMATRVSLGHSGRPLEMSRFIWVLFWGINLTALVRIMADLPGIIGPTGNHFNLLAALLWLLCFGLWSAQFAPIYLRRRVDGMSG